MEDICALNVLSADECANKGIGKEYLSLSYRRGHVCHAHCFPY